MGMMSWALLPLCYIAKQLEATGSVSNSLLVSVGLMEIYVFKFFLCALHLSQGCRKDSARLSGLQS